MPGSNAIALTAVLTGKWAAVVARCCLVAHPLSGHALVAALLLAMVGPGLAADLAVTDGDTIRLDRTTYRLGSIDAPEIDQTCVNQAGEIWPCGVAARDRLTAHIGNRAVRCKDEGPDPDHKHRQIGICSIEGETATLNEWLVREGWAIRFGSSATGRFAPEEADARENRRGLWSGCFAEPLDFRRWNLSGARLVGGGCQLGHQNRTRVKLFRVDTDMPPGCPIKAKFALRAVGYEGIYHLPACGSYPRLKRAQRWFCSEEDASAAGFRKALTCR
ncbi:thermonuclease family protein [Bradyrhizobium sp.]|uniref:thermonuclease family protein n=1 Tax=Bradyrhizobium sp. TaxID=376 RepID=UPI00351E7B2A